jgi:hypothetical protein
MGAHSIVVTAHGKNINEAFKNAQKEAEEEHGSNPYNGAINNCSFIRDVTNKLGQFSESDYLDEWIIDNTNKREIMGYCISEPKLNTNKTKSHVERIPQKGTRKWVTKYEAYNLYNHEEVHVSSDKLDDCISKARKLVEAGRISSLDVRITKHLEVGNTKCARVNYKKSKTERAGTYVFVGFAPC